MHNNIDKASRGGGTLPSGWYSIYWFSPSMPSAAAIRLYMNQESDRVKVTTMAENVVHVDLFGVPIVDGSTVDNVSWTWGGPGNPEPYSNLYDGAMKTWSFALSQSGQTTLTFFGMVKAFDSAPTSQNSAFQEPNTQKVVIGTPNSQAYMPSSRVMHELGHAAHEALDPAIGTHIIPNAGWYCWSSKTGNCTHTYEEAEWLGASWMEGWANFIAAASLYAKNAVQPHVCVSAALNTGGVTCPTQAGPSCNNSGCDVEWSTGFGTTGCFTNSARWQINDTRYLWDIYDSRVDSASVSSCSGTSGNLTDNVDRSMADIFTGMASYVAGIADRQKNEPFSNTGLTAYDDRDGRRDRDFRWNFQNRAGFGDTGNLMCPGTRCPGSSPRRHRNHHLRPPSRPVARSWSPR